MGIFDKFKLGLSKSSKNLSSGLNNLIFRKKIDESYNLLGKDYFFRNQKELGYKKFRRSIYVVQDIKKGEKFTVKNIKRIRPGYGLEPKYYNLLLGRRAKSNFKSGNPLKKNILNFYKFKKG